MKFVFKELGLQVRSEVKTNNSKTGVKFKQKGTEKVLQEELRVNNVKTGSLVGAEGHRWGEAWKVAFRAERSWF